MIQREPSQHGAPLKTKNGFYYGTTVGKSWWKRYKQGGWFSRGNGEMWIDREGIHFHRYLTKDTKTIPLHAVKGVEIGRWHAGKWTGAPVIKITWEEGPLELVSGFSISWKRQETERWVAELRKLLAEVERR